MDNIENDIAFRALLQLEQLIGIKGVFTQYAFPSEIDGEVLFDFGDRSLRLYVEIKKEIRTRNLHQAINYADTHPPFMVIADKIFPDAKMELKKRNVGFLDGAGNIFLKQAGYIFLIEGQKFVQEEKPVTNRAFTKTGLKAVFNLLLDERNLNSTHRELARLSGVAHGNVNYILEGLNEAGYILQVNNRKKILKNKKDLLDRWITGYQELLKPSLYVGSYVFGDKSKFERYRTLLEDREETVWGGEPGADLLTDYLSPEYLTLYTENGSKVVKDWTLFPKNNGPLKIYNKFWKASEWDQRKLAPPLLIYADLLLTNDPRCLEVADRIYEKYLEDEFEKR